MLEKKDTFTREEVIDMLRAMQSKTCHTHGFFVGHVTQLWVIQDLLGKQIEALDGESIKITIV